MRAGKLRHSIEIQQAIETQGGTGAPVKTWQTFTQTRASYEPMTGKEIFAANQEQATSTTRFRTRFVDGVTPKMRIIFKTRIFNITSAIDVYGRGRELEILAVEDV